MSYLLTAFTLWLLWVFIVPPEGLHTLARERLYKSGTIWCAWRWTDVESEYILRLHVIKTPWFAICLHWINKPDKEPWLHDHPVSFLSLILRGGYAENRDTGRDAPPYRVHRWFNFVQASKTDRHRIAFVRKNTLALCFMGPKVREWGFHMPGEWVMWKDYYARLKAGEDMRGEHTIARFDAFLKGCYTAERMRNLFGAPLGDFVDEDTRELDTAPAADFHVEEVTPYGDFTISREDFYKKVKFSGES